MKLKLEVAQYQFSFIWITITFRVDDMMQDILHGSGQNKYKLNLAIVNLKHTFKFKKYHRERKDRSNIYFLLFLMKRTRKK